MSIEPIKTRGDESSIVPFGKYKDQPVDTLLADSGYVAWVLAQPGIVVMLKARHPALFNIMTVGAPANDDTPEHNRFQAKFLERDFQYAFLEIMLGESVLSYAEGRAKQRDDDKRQQLQWAKEKLRKESLSICRGQVAKGDLSRGAGELGATAKAAGRT